MTQPDHSSAFRFEKRRVEALIHLIGGEEVRGSFFVADERVGDLLIHETGFFPFEIQTSDGPRTVLYNRANLITVLLSESESVREPAYPVARRRDVWLLLSDGRRVRGVVRVYRPEGRDRLSDWAREPESFRYIDTEDGTLLVNAAHIVAMTEEPLA